MNGYKQLKVFLHQKCSLKINVLKNFIKDRFDTFKRVHCSVLHGKECF